MVIAFAGVTAAFAANVISFCGVILVVARWKRPIRQQTTPTETMIGATVAAVRYVRNSPAIVTVLVRTGTILFFSSSLFALLPSVAKSVDERAIGYGLLRARFSTEMIVSAGVVILGTGVATITLLHKLSTLALVIFVTGAAWVLFISLINALMQTLAPDWVRARVSAIFTLVYMGSFALGSAAWGGVAQHRSVWLALVCSGFGTIGSAIIAPWARLPDSTADLSPWNH